MSTWLPLALTSVAEVIGTSAHKASEGFKRPWPSVVVVLNVFSNAQPH